MSLVMEASLVVVRKGGPHTKGMAIEPNSFSTFPCLFPTNFDTSAIIP